jgi:hypothetical protein
MGMIMRVMGVAMIVATVMVVIVMVLFARGCHVTAVVVRRIEVALGASSLRLPTILTTLLEATATATTTSATAAAACAAFTVAIATRLVGLGRTVLLQGDLLMQGLLAHVL